MKEEFIILGALGHIGYNVVSLLTKQNKKVRVLIHDKKHEDKLPKVVAKYYGDITKIDTLQDIFKSDKKTILYVINCVNYFSMDENDCLLKEINFQGTKNIIKMCEESRVDKYVHVSNFFSLSNDHAYGKIKKEANDYVIGKKNNLNVSVVVPGLFAGPNDFRGNIFNKYFYNIYTKSSKYFADLDLYYIDVINLANSIINVSLYGENGKRYEIYSDKIKLKELFDKFLTASEISYKIKYISVDKLFKHNNLINKYWNLKKIKPKYTLELLSTLNTATMTDKAIGELDLKFIKLDNCLLKLSKFLKISKDL